MYRICYIAGGRITHLSLWILSLLSRWLTCLRALACELQAVCGERWWHGLEGVYDYLWDAVYGDEQPPAAARNLAASAPPRPNPPARHLRRPFPTTLQIRSVDQTRRHRPCLQEVHRSRAPGHVIARSNAILYRQRELAALCTSTTRSSRNNFFCPATGAAAAAPPPACAPEEEALPPPAAPSAATARCAHLEELARLRRGLLLRVGCAL